MTATPAPGRRRKLSDGKDRPTKRVRREDAHQWEPAVLAALVAGHCPLPLALGGTVAEFVPPGHGYVFSAAFSDEAVHVAAGGTHCEWSGASCTGDVLRLARLAEGVLPGERTRVRFHWPRIPPPPSANCTVNSAEVGAVVGGAELLRGVPEADVRSRPGFFLVDVHGYNRGP